MELYGLPVVVKGKVYVRGMSGGTNTVLEYTPSSDVWDTLPPPHTVNYFTIATLNEHLVLVGGTDQSTYKVSKKIAVWDSAKHQWIYPYPSMTTGRVVPAAVGYRDHLIVACGLTSERNRISNVDILDTTSNKWLTAESLPDTDLYQSVIIEDTLYLVGDNRNVLRANIPTLISRARSTKHTASQSVWESLPNAPIYRSSPFAIDNVLMTVGGGTSDNISDPNLTTSIQLYNPTNNIWTKVGDLPEAVFNCPCTVISGQLLVLGGWKRFFNFTRSVYISKLIMQY